MKYPEHEKMAKIKDQSQIIGEFLERVNIEHGYSLAQEGRDHLQPIRLSTIEILARYFDIDLNKIELEKRQMLESLRK